MGEWKFPDHYSEAAKGFRQASRVAEIEVFERMALPHMRMAAREHGYALAVHGSRARDFDLIAVPWTADAADTRTVVQAIADAVKHATGWGHIAAGSLDAELERPAGQKPHGRRSITILGTSDVHVDLSVMPPVGGSLEALLPTKPCDMGVGCDEAGVCYADAHDEPDRCPRN